MIRINRTNQNHLILIKRRFQLNNKKQTKKKKKKSFYLILLFGKSTVDIFKNTNKLRKKNISVLIFTSISTGGRFLR